MRLAGRAAGPRDELGARGFWRRRYHRIPVKQTAATVAGKKLALTELVPRLRADAHAAAGALLVFRAGNGCAARGGEAVETGKHVRLNQLAHGFAALVERGQLRSQFLLAARNTGADGFGVGSHRFHFSTGAGQRRLLLFAALQAGDFLGFKAVGLGRGKLDLVLDGFSLRGRLYGIDLGAEAGGLLAVLFNLAFQARAQRLLARKRGGDFSRAVLSGGQSGLSLRNFAGQDTHLFCDAGPLQFEVLQFHQIFNTLFHRSKSIRHLPPIAKTAKNALGVQATLNAAISGVNGAAGASKETAAKCCESETWRESGLAKTQRSFWRSHRWLVWTGGGVLTALIALVAVVLVTLHHIEPFLRARIVSELEEHFHARVQLDSFHISLVDGLWAEGKGLRIWPPHQSQAAGSKSEKPIIQLSEFRFHAPLRFRPGKPIRISVVQLRGLKVDLPPKEHLGHAVAAVAHSKEKSEPLVHISLGAIECRSAHLTLETSKPGKQPLEFAIARLKLTGISSGGAMKFSAELTNPRPVGTIDTKGQFGPWVVDDPGKSAVKGSYRFTHANLGGFKGIAGILSSTGHYRGTLRDLTVDGETNTPNFRLSSGGEAMDLRTRFHAHVDGTDGDTWLEPVDATLGHSHLIARGRIVHVRARKAGHGQPAHPAGHDIVLNVKVDRGRIEDFLRLANHGKPLLTGALTMKTKLDIPPGAGQVRDRMRLKGNFALTDVRFTNAKLQHRIGELSMKGRGKSGDDNSRAAAHVRSTMRSDFRIANDVVRLTHLVYKVPGAQIDLNGNYGVTSGALHFTGNAKLQATISQMVGGWKGLLLKPLDPLFEHGGAGTAVPVTVGGTRANPKFTINFAGLKKTVHK